MTPSPQSPVTSDGSEPSLNRLQTLIEHAGELLPAQGPINVFIHHNTLHAFEDLPFDEGVQTGAKIFGCQPYLSEDRYRDELIRGRILSEDLNVVLREDLGPAANQPVLSFCTRFDLQMARLQHSLRFGPTAELLWFVAETDALKRMRSEVSSSVRERVIGKTRHWIMRNVRSRGSEGSNGSSSDPNPQIYDLLSDIFESCGESTIESWSPETWEAFTLQTLWRICREGVRHVSDPPVISPPPVRPRDGLLDATGIDIDLLVHSVLIRFCASYLDQGFAHWHLPNREQGFFRAFVTLYRQPVGPPDRWLRGLTDELRRLDDAHLSPLQSIQESLDILGIPESEWHEFISATLLALRGWAGMIRQVELRSDSVAHPITPGSLIDFLAIRLILERFALRQVAGEFETRSEDLSQTRPECGHATNAICIVGRRTHTRGLFLDRRAFLTSYDPTQDDADSSILARILAAAVPVCAGINLEYYFSYVDNTGFGCGAKLPHNVTALLGVMDGAASDLRTGLPWQMVEIHEPVRWLFVIETTPKRMLSIMDRNAGIGILVRQGWIHLAVMDTESHQIQLFREGEFKPYRPEAVELPQAASSADWYRGWRRWSGRDVRLCRGGGRHRGGAQRHRRGAGLLSDLYRDDVCLDRFPSHRTARTIRGADSGRHHSDGRIVSSTRRQFALSRRARTPQSPNRPLV